ncbi:MAG: tRNA lysidine(34) synthetase TilS [Chitinophagales bacterium]|nr:tRNA lysidine(34) synthetase TilS [Bacteroidota bacterium]MCB9043865.1 tRNA lysidine(34) synthetase TilS [Chitinophagales bacterium]
MIAEFIYYLTKHCRVNSRRSIIVAVSGGIDSVVLAHLFRQANWHFGIAHCNFMLRGNESDEDALFVQQLAQAYKVPFWQKNFPTAEIAASHKGSVQMIARELRYQWFEEIRQQENYHFIATAHHANDQIETLLLNLCKGTGINGLQAMLPKQNYLVRPLLEWSKEQIETYAQENKLLWRTDSSNASDKYQRNLLRHQVIPVLETINPSLNDTFIANIRHFQDTAKIYQQAIDTFSQKLLKKQGDIYKIAIRQLLQYEGAASILFEIVKKFDFNATQCHEIMQSFEGISGKIFLSSSHRLIKDRNFLLIHALDMPQSTWHFITEKERKIKTPYFDIKINCKKIAKYAPENNAKIAALDCDKLVFPLKLRPWQQGDYFYPLGLKKASGKAAKKKLSKFFINEKMSLLDKEQCLVLEDAQQRIVWVVGRRIDQRFCVTPQTQKVFHLRLWHQKS